MGSRMQVMAVGDRFVMTRYLSIQDIGVYSMGVSFGLIEKIVLGAFEYAWAPFYYATAREAGCRPRFQHRSQPTASPSWRSMTAGLSAIAADLLERRDAWPIRGGGSDVVTWTAVGVLFYGVYLLTSIGLNITGRTGYYPVTTAIGAGVNIGLNFLADSSVRDHRRRLGERRRLRAFRRRWRSRFSQRFYPVRYEVRTADAGDRARRSLRIVAARALPAMPPLLGVVTRGATVVVVDGRAAVGDTILQRG